MLLVVAAFLAYALVVTWPFAVYPRSTIFGTLGSDLTGGITRIRELAQAHHLPFLPGRVGSLDAPDGLDTQWALDLATLPSSLLLWVLAVVAGGNAGNSLFVVVNFVGSASAMFLLTRRLTGQALPALVAGLAFGFSPYGFGFASQPLGSGWVLVLAFWRAVELAERPTRANALWMGAAAVLVVAWIQYWILIGGVFLTSLAIAGLFVAARRGCFELALRRWLAAGAMAVAWLLMVLVITAASSEGFSDVPKRDVRDSISLSARPLMYVIPSPSSPVAGRWTKHFLFHRFAGGMASASYTPIYLGLSTLALALLGGWAIRGRIRFRARPGRDRTAPARGPDADPAATGLLLAGAVAIVALVFSGPPEVDVAGLQVPLPGHFVNGLTTVFRATGRFAYVVLLGLCVFAAFGVQSILRGQNRVRTGLLCAGLAVVVALDMWNLAPPGSTRVVDPPVARVLAAQPPGVVAAYPLNTAVNTDTLDVYFQDAFAQPLFNGFHSESVTESRKIELQNLTAPTTPSRLARYGVRYVLVRHLERRGAPAGYPRPGAPVRGLRKLAEDRRYTLYRVTARPSRSLILGRSGFAPPEGDPVRFFRWMSKPEAVLDVQEPCARCVGTLRFDAGTFVVPRTLTVRDDHDRVLARVAVNTAGQKVRIPVRFSRRIALRLQIDPPPKSPASLSPGNPDTRPLGIFVEQPIRFVPNKR